MVGFEFGTRETKFFENLSKKIAHIDPQEFASDNREAYDLIDPSKRLIGKSHTYNVDRMNRLLRHYLASFTRKAYCCSKSLDMINNSILLFLYRKSLSYMTFYHCLITLVTSEPRQIVGLDIALDKNENRAQNIVDNAPKARFYYSDADPSYQKVSYWGKHYYFNDKSHTFTVGGVNSDIRKYIAALQRRSKCFFVL